MSEEKQHHHLFHHHREDDEEQVPQSVDMYGEGNAQSYECDNALKEEKHHKHMEELAEAGALATGGFALVLNSEELLLACTCNGVQHEKHEEKKDPENAHRHKLEEELAAAAAVGEGGYGFHEHHDKKECEEEDEEAHGKKHHHIF